MLYSSARVVIEILKNIPIFPLLGTLWRLPINRSKANVHHEWTGPKRRRNSEMWSDMWWFR
jgi:hypothetical protein